MVRVWRKRLYTGQGLRKRFLGDTLGPIGSGPVCRRIPGIVGLAQE